MLKTTGRTEGERHRQREFLASISDFSEYIRRGAVDVVRLNADNVEGYVLAPTAPGLGYPIDRDTLDKMIMRIDA